MISHKGLVFLNNVSKMLFHHAAYTHVNMHTSILPHFHLYSLIIFLKENKSGGTYKRGCRVLRRNQTSFRLSLGFPINVASVFEVQGKDKKNGKEKGSSQTGIKAESKASLPVSFFELCIEPGIADRNFKVFTCISLLNVRCIQDETKYHECIILRSVPFSRICRDSSYG